MHWPLFSLDEMATITPWIAGLAESELENVIAWKSVVKAESDAGGEDTPPRFREDGSNLRSSIGSPTLGQESMVQLLQVPTPRFLWEKPELTASQKPGLSARDRIPVSDGEVFVLVVLSDAAWEAYDKGISDERGDEPRKGDLLICKRIVVVSTAFGPFEERITFRIEELEYAGNIRITIGKPTPLLERPSIVSLRDRIENLFLNNHQNGEMEDESVNEDEETNNGPAVAPAQSVQTQSGASVDVEMETVIDVAPEILADAVPTSSLNPQPAIQQEEEQAVAEAPSPRPTHTSPIVSKSSAQFQIDTQLEVEATQAQAQAQAPPAPVRNPVRRSRGGGYSMGHEGFETTRGDNLAGPQAPTLHKRIGFASAELPRAEPPKDQLLNLLSKLPGVQPKNRTPEPSAPVSAQQEQMVEEVVVETPAKKKASATTIAVEDAAPAPAQKPSLVVASNEIQRKRKRVVPASLESTSAPRRIYRIPKNQQALLDDQSSWLPPAPGHEFPHPNVPVKLLSLWNTKAELDTSSTSQPSPIALIKRSSGEKSVEEVQLEADADESESDSEELMSADELIEWSQSQARSQALPPDSSAGPPPSAHSFRPGPKHHATSIQGHAAISTNGPSDTRKGSRGKSTSSGSQRESPRPVIVAKSLLKQKDQAMLETYDKRVRNPAQDIVASHPASSSRQNATTPAGAPKTQASPAMSQTAKQRSTPQNSPRPPASGANARPVQRQNQQRPAATPVASQPIPTGPRKSAALADNHRGPVQASTQQTPHRPYKAAEPTVGSSFATPSGAPTEPRAIRESRHSLPNRSLSGSSRTTPDPKSLPYGGFYCPQPSGQRRATLPPGSQKDTAPSKPKSDVPPSQTSKPNPAGTQMSEMETSVPRALPTNEHRQERSKYMRGAQRRYW